VVHEPAAAFALDALEPDEAAEFEQHLVACPACEDELARLQAAAGALAFAVDLPVPPPGLRARVLDLGAPVIPLRRRRPPRLVSAACVLAAACVALVLGLRASGDGGGMHRYSARGADATLLVAKDRAAVLVVRRLQPAPAGRAYEAWIIDRGRAVPAGILRGSVLALTRPVPPGAAVGVTVERAGGSPRPTGPLLFRAETA
jgi:anti-sigma factor RsiW